MPFPPTLCRTSSSLKGCIYTDAIPVGKEPSTSALLALLSSPASAGNSTGAGTNLPTGFAQAKFSSAAARTSETALLLQKSTALAFEAS